MYPKGWTIIILYEVVYFSNALEEIFFQFFVPKLLMQSFSLKVENIAYKFCRPILYL